MTVAHPHARHGAQQIRQNYDSPELQFQPSPQTGQQSALGASAAWDGRCASAGEKTAAPRKAGQGGDRPPLRPLISAATCSRRFGGARIAAKAATRSPHPTLHAQPPPPKEVLCSLSLSLSLSFSSAKPRHAANGPRFVIRLTVHSEA